MPNYVHCTMRSMNKETHELFRAMEMTGTEYEEFNQLPDDVISLNKIVKLPAELRNTTSPNRSSEAEKQALIDKYGAADWYDWSIKNWGTKWDVGEVYLDRDSDLGVTDINWNSPWDIPDQAILTLSKQYEDHIILVRFCCEFDEYKGTRVYQNGKELYKSNYQFDEEKDIWSAIEEEVE